MYFLSYFNLISILTTRLKSINTIKLKQQKKFRLFTFIRTDSFSFSLLTILMATFLPVL